jgi:undecaprenyl-diphosphatase
LAPEAAAGLAPTKIVPFRHPWRATGELLFAWVLIGAVLVGVGTVVVSHAPSFDDAVPSWLAAHETPRLTTLSQFLSMPGSTRPILAVGLAVGPVAIALIGRWRPAVFLVLIMLGEVLLFVAVAALVGRPRPDVPQLDGHLPTAAFPSGHTAAAMCLYGAFAVLIVPRTRGSWRWLAVAVAVALPALVGLSRMYRGAHHPLDVVGGIVLALLWLSVVTLAVRPNADLYDLVDRTVPPEHATPTAGVPAVEGQTVVPSPGVQEAT